MKSTVRKILSYIGPYPYNPTLIFLFFFSVFFARFIPEIVEKPRGWPSYQTFGLVIIYAFLPSFTYALLAHFTQKYRKWSDKNLFFYLCEVTFAGVALVIYHPIFVSSPFKDRGIVYSLVLTTSPGFFIWGLCLVLFVLALLHRAERTILNRLANADLLVKKLEADSQQLILSDEEMRRQISQFLHDRVQSDLMVVAMELKNIQSKSAENVEEVINRSIEKLENTRSSDLRNLVHILTPRFEGGGLSEALEYLKLQYRSTFILSLFLESNFDFLQEKQRLGIFRIIEQGLLNCAVHGPAKNVLVSISIDPGRIVRVVIHDDGPGVDRSLIENGIGTAMIDSWVKILNATKNISTSPGNGYKLEVLFSA